MAQQVHHHTGETPCEIRLRLLIAQVAVTRSTSTRCVVAADDEVIAGEEPVVELAEPKRRSGHDPNSGRGDEPTPGRYLLISRNGHSQ
jgi:hypothetical protein